MTIAPDRWEGAAGNLQITPCWIVLENENDESEAVWAEAIACYLRGEAGWGKGVRNVEVGFEKSLYIPPYDTKVSD